MAVFDTINVMLRLQFPWAECQHTEKTETAATVKSSNVMKNSIHYHQPQNANFRPAHTHTEITSTMSAKIQSIWNVLFLPFIVSFFWHFMVLLRQISLDAQPYTQIWTFFQLDFASCFGLLKFIPLNGINFET